MPQSAGSSHGLSFRVARGLYYRPSTFRGRVIEKEETVHQDTGLFGFTTKHIYFSGPKKKCRVRYDKFVDFEPYDDGFGIMKDSQTAGVQDQRRLVGLQPSRKSGTDGIACTRRNPPRAGKRIINRNTNPTYIVSQN